jgi:hypothetical protein
VSRRQACARRRLVSVAAEQPSDAQPVPIRPRASARDYTPEQDAALDRLAHLLAEFLERELDEQRPDLARRRHKSV